MALKISLQPRAARGWHEVWLKHIALNRRCPVRLPVETRTGSAKILWRDASPAEAKG
jgi:hypothetical protein